MSTLIEIAIAVAAIWGLLWFLRKVIPRRSDEDDRRDFAHVMAPVSRGPRGRTTAAKVDEPDED